MAEIKTAGREPLLKQRSDNTRLALECAKLNLAEEQALADEDIVVEAARWPEY